MASCKDPQTVPDPVPQRDRAVSAITQSPPSPEVSGFNGSNTILPLNYENTIAEPDQLLLTVSAAWSFESSISAASGDSVEREALEPHPRALNENLGGKTGSSV